MLCHSKLVTLHYNDYTDLFIYLFYTFTTLVGISFGTKIKVLSLALDFRRGNKSISVHYKYLI